MKAYLRDVIDAGWICHIVAHSHGGNVALAAVKDLTLDTPGLGHVITVGTPIIQFRDAEEIYDRNLALRRVATVVLFWLALFAPAVLLTPETFTRSPLLSLSNILVVLATTFLLWLITTAIRVRRYVRAFATDPDDVWVSKKVLVINSRGDEACNFLELITTLANPLGDEAAPQRRSSALVRAGRMIHARDVAYFGARVGIVNSAAVAAILLIALPIVLIPVFPASSRWLVVDYFVLVLAALFTIGRFSRQAVGEAVLFPVRMGEAFVLYFVTLARELIAQILERYWRRRAWRTLQEVALGILGAPFGPHHITVAKTLTQWFKYESDYAELPEGVVDRVGGARDEFLRSHLSAVTAMLSQPSVNATALAALWAELQRTALVHYAYYRDPEAIGMIADRLSAKIEIEELW